MTAATGQGQRPIRVGNCSGFYGDRASAMADMARAGGIDVLNRNRRTVVLLDPLEES